MAWPTATSDELSGSPLDLSFLNAPEIPAGKHGFLHGRGDRLIFQDGSMARFWGTNLTAYALFGTPRDSVGRQARRLAKLGFNLVRFHHHDSGWVHPNIFGDANAADTQHLDADMLDRLDWWMKCLKDQGIYVWLDLEVGRQLKASDGIEAFDEIRQGSSTAGVPGYSYVNESIRAALKRFNEAYLNHRNPYTGLRYKDDPAIAAILISNENDLTHHYGNALLPDKGVPWHSAKYLREADRFATAHRLPRDQVWRAWVDGPAKLFLNDLEWRFDLDMIEHLRSLGLQAPIVTTSTWGNNPLSSLPALTSGDIIDVHAYGGEGELLKNPQSEATLVHWMAAAHVAGRPLTVTEWGVARDGSFASDRQDIPLYVAASASMQGWSAVMFYAYSEEALADGGTTASIYQAYDDPAIMAALPAAALVFRQSHVREATTRYVFAPSALALSGQAISAVTSVALRTATERGKLSIALPAIAELPWLAASPIPDGARILHDPGLSEIPTNAVEAVSDSGELERNWARGIFTIDTPRTQAAMGSIGGRLLALRDVDITVSAKNAVVAVQSLDGNDIRLSRRILISVGARSVPTAPRTLPFHSEPVSGEISIRAPDGLALTGGGSRGAQIQAVPRRDGRYRVTLAAAQRGSWWVLGADRAGRDPLTKGMSAIGAK